MLTSIRSLTAASFFVTTALVSAPALASDLPVEADSAELVDIDASQVVVDIADVDVAAVLPEIGAAEAVKLSAPVDLANDSKVGGESGLELSGNVALVTDYRFRGVSFSDGDPALQGGIDLAHSSGLYVGTWGSTITGGTAFGELELDVYAGWSGDVAEGVTFDIGLLYYIYPTGDFPGVDTDYFEPYASVSTQLGPVSATLGAAYAWEQDSLGGQDNIYVYTDFEFAIPETPVSLTAHLGYTDGVFSTDTNSTSFDWGLGASYAVTDSLSLGVNYVDTQGPSVEDFSDAGIFFTLGYSM